MQIWDFNLTPADLGWELDESERDAREYEESVLRCEVCDTNAATLTYYEADGAAIYSVTTCAECLDAELIPTAQALGCEYHTTPIDMADVAAGAAESRHDR